MLKTADHPYTSVDSQTCKKLVVAIPCFNTQEFIGDVVSRAKKYVDEVIVIDDGSTDKTVEMAKAAGAVVISHGINKGYGEAIKSCLAAARDNKADLLVTIDGDGQHNPDEIPQFLNHIIKKKADLVIGSRFLQDGHFMPHYRKFGIGTINQLWNFGSKVKIGDTQSGFRAYSKKVLEVLHLKEKGMAISIEILEIIRRKKAKIIEIPITCSYENNNDFLTLKAFKHGFNVAYSVLRIRMANRFIRNIKTKRKEIKINNSHSD